MKAGDLLVELDSTSTGADAARTRQELNAARLEAARLRVVLGLDDGTILNTPPEGVAQAEFASAGYWRRPRSTAAAFTPAC